MKDLIKVLLLLALTIIGMISCSRHTYEASPEGMAQKSILNNDAYETGLNRQVRITVLANDLVDKNGTLVFKVPGHGSLHTDSMGLVYQPNLNFRGTDQFYYKYNSAAGTDSARVSISVM
jgi:hypothetical protein